MSFIDAYIKAFNQAESPESFFRWSAICAISAVIRKNVFINKKIYKLYPNLYVMLVAKSGLRKGYPVKQAQKLVEGLEIVKVISGRNSIQAILTELSKQWTLESGKILRNAQAFVVNDELDSLLIGDPSAQTILTALYDSFYHKKWMNTLKKDGKEVLNELYLTMLSATNPDHLEHFLDKSSIKGGFIGRTLLVFEDKKSKINPLIEENDATEIDTKPLAESLIKISELKGQLSFTPKAVSRYKSWYQEFYESLEDGSINDDTGTAERAGDMVLKLATILAADIGSLIVELPQIEESIDLFYDCASSSRRVLASLGGEQGENTNKAKLVLGYLLTKKTYSAFKKQILAAKYGELDSNDLARAAETLQEAGLIEIIKDGSEGWNYKITDEYIEKLKKRMGE